MRQRPYWLVVQQSGATGIVTRSDMLKLPVRLYAFALMIHLEIVVASLISLLYPDGHESWLVELSEKRQDDIKKRYGQLAARRDNPDWLELTYFSDKVTILVGEKAMQNRTAAGGASASWQTPEGLRSTLWQVNETRNEVAHPRNYATDEAGLNDFSELLDLCETRSPSYSGMWTALQVRRAEMTGATKAAFSVE